MIVTVDFETYYADDYTLAKMSINEYVKDSRFKIYGCSIKIDNAPAQWYAGSDSLTALRSIDWGRVTLVCQNAYFDAFILSHWYKIHPYCIHDTMLMSRALHGNEVSNSLEAQARRYGLEKAMDLYEYKGRKDLTADELIQMGNDCNNHTDLTKIIHDKLIVDFPELELEIIDITVKMFTEPVLHLNKELLEENLENERCKKLQALEQVKWLMHYMPPTTIQTFPPEPVNWFEHIKSILMSNDKFADALACTIAEKPIAEILKKKSQKYYAKLGVPTKTSLTTGDETYAFSKRDDALVQLMETNQKVKSLIEARLAVKSTLEEERTKQFISMAGDKLPIYLKYYGAHTGRDSGGGGINPQNMPRGSLLRQAIEAPPGYKLGVADSSQIEARMNMWLAWKAFGGKDGCKAGLDTFANNGDIYSEFASVAYGFSVNKKEHPNERFVGKQCILGLGYQMSAAKLQWQLKSFGGVDMSLDECERLVKVYRETYWQIPKQWYALNDLITIIHERGEAIYGAVIFNDKGIRLPNGLHLVYRGLEKTGDKWSYKTRKQGQTKTIHLYGGKVTENIIQALARIAVFEQMVKINKRYRVVLRVHDEVVFLLPDAEAESGTAWAIDIMHQVPEWAKGCPLAAEGGYAQNYSK